MERAYEKSFKEKLTQYLKMKQGVDKLKTEHVKKIDEWKREVEEHGRTEKAEILSDEALEIWEEYEAIKPDYNALAHQVIEWYMRMENQKKEVRRAGTQTDK